MPLAYLQYMAHIQQAPGKNDEEVEEGEVNDDGETTIGTWTSIETAQGVLSTTAHPRFSLENLFLVFEPSYYPYLFVIIHAIVSSFWVHGTRIASSSLYYSRPLVSRAYPLHLSPTRARPT